MDKMIEMHGIEVDNTCNTVRHVHLASIICKTFNFQPCFVTVVDGTPICTGGSRFVKEFVDLLAFVVPELYFVHEFYCFETYLHARSRQA